MDKYAFDAAIKFANDKLLREKAAAQLITGKRQTKPVHSFTDRTVFDNAELAPPTAADYDNWRTIMRQMETGAPYQLADAKVLSGRVSPRHIVNSIADRAGEDTFLESVLGDRSMVAQAYSALTPTSLEQEDASYHPYANAVILNNRSPGVLIHELGHAIDLSRAPGQSNFRRAMRWQFKPTLMSEYSAWKKGPQAYREGFAAELDGRSDKDMEQYLANMQSVSNRKYPAFGTYLGGSLGALTGGAIGLGGSVAAAMAADRDSGRAISRLIAASTIGGAALGGISGTIAGGLLGKFYAKLRSRGLREREISKLEKTLKDPRIAALRQQQQTTGKPV